MLRTALLSLLASSMAFTAPASYQIDTAHTQTYFTVNHMGFSNSTGAVRVKEGTLTFDDADWSKSKVDVTLDIGSLQFGDKTWNEHMSDAKFFNVAKFPTAKFVSTKVEKLGDSTGKVTGNLTLLGVSKAVTLMITKNKVDKNPMSGKPYAGFSATASLTRSDWGMNAYVPNVGDAVTLRIEVEASGK
jgi:polyisoprenoid-binding protein YceI